MKKFEELTVDELKALYEEKVKQETIKQEKLEEERPKRWRVKNEKYWFINSNGVIDYQWDKHSYENDFRYNAGNYFQTKEQAKEYKKKLLLQQAYKDWCAFDCDWNNCNQEKLCAVYDFYNCKISFIYSYTYDIKTQGIIYAESRERIQEFIDKIGEEEFIKYILEVNSNERSRIKTNFR